MPLLGELIRIRPETYTPSDVSDLTLINKFSRLIDRLIAYSPAAWREDALQELRLVILLANRHYEETPPKTDVETALKDHYGMFSRREIHHGVVYAPPSFNYASFVHILYRRTHGIENRGGKVKSSYPDSYSTKDYGKCAPYVLVVYHNSLFTELALEYQRDREILRLIRDGDNIAYIAKVLSITVDDVDERITFLGKTPL